MSRLRPIIFSLALLTTLLAGSALAAPAGPPPASPGSAPAGLPATAPAQQVVVVNNGPSMEDLKKETPSLFQNVLGGFLGALGQSLKAALDTAQSFNFLSQTPPGLSYQHLVD